MPNVGLQWEGVRRLQGVGRKGVEGGLSEGEMEKKKKKEEKQKGWRGTSKRRLPPNQRKGR